MIVYQRYPGAWYADALPDRTFAVLYPQDVTIDATGRVQVTTEGWMQTHLGPIALPVADEPLYHRITNTNGFQIAGQAHFSRQTWVWTSIGWRSTIPACGVSPVIYDRLGILHLSDCSIGSQGWRYVQDDGTSTGRLVTGDNTYGPLHALNEFTELGGGILVGQGNPDAGAPMAAALVWDGSRHRLLEDGPCRFIRVTRAGDRIAVATWKEGFGAVLAWLTLADLLELPVVAAPTPKPVPPPSPVPVPPPPTPAPVPKPSPAPSPPAAPPPAPAGEPMPDPTYDQFVKEESHDVRTAYMAAIGREPAVDDYYHNAWRRLVERWTHRDILHDIKHEPLEDGGAGGADHPP